MGSKMGELMEPDPANGSAWHFPAGTNPRHAAPGAMPAVVGGKLPTDLFKSRITP